MFRKGIIGYINGFSEFQKQYQGEVGEENKNLKQQLETLRNENKCLQEKNKALINDCKALTNRCYYTLIMTSGVKDMMCMHCVLKEYECEYYPSIEMQEKIGKEIKNMIKDLDY